VKLNPNCIRSITQSQKLVEKIIREKKVVYTVSTGVAGLSGTVIDAKTSEEFQRRVLYSCAVGVGQPFEEEVVRAAILCRLNTFATGHSGVRLQVAEFLEDLLNRDVYPYVPEQGSLGCSGDIAPLAHIALLSLGLGEVIHNGKREPSTNLLIKNGFRSLVLKSKEAVSLVNGCSLSAGIAGICCYDASNLLKFAEIVSSLSTEALQAWISGFDPLLNSAKPHKGQIKVSNDVLRLIDGSTLVKESQNDPYTIKAIPQVLGTASDAIDFARDVINVELNSSSDNPLLFPNEDRVISGANFHAQEVAFVMDALAIALTPVGDLSERRVERLLNPMINNKLPAFLVNKPGINSGFLDAQFTVAALAAENKTLCVPASVNPSFVSAGTEDHASQAPIAGRKLRKLITNLEYLFSIELLCAVQAIDFRLRSDPHAKMGKGTQVAYDICRKLVEPLTEDRIMYQDFEKVQKVVHSEELVKSVERRVGPLLEKPVLSEIEG
jgi:histidine ammonia-lyase